MTRSGETLEAGPEKDENFYGLGPAFYYEGWGLGILVSRDI